MEIFLLCFAIFTFAHLSLEEYAAVFFEENALNILTLNWMSTLRMKF